MTREEARMVVFQKCKQLEGRESGYLVDALEALGLLKFEEEKSEGKSSSIDYKPQLDRVVFSCNNYDIYRLNKLIEPYGYIVSKKLDF